ncbi:PREDICTED: uncharacterized serine-rich protein C215.13-like [Camelina sativa]|uniref:Uncharacterized serine-rich protein C215.13-like n=1 Tax=Camelina sativa TaxID=90675 RepID=A0ABM0V769_CAMSA|nr:PREDICTED: uncharacterized serine-rich protein C215.13-like [Camelina sativa]
MRRHEKGHRPMLLMGSDHKSSRTTTMSSRQYSLRTTAADIFLYSENEKSDYEWLVTPPGSPTRSVTNQLDSPYGDRMTLISRLENYSKEERDNVPPKTQKTSLHNSSSVSGIRRPSSSSSSRSTSRPSSPSRRSTPAKRPSTPTSSATSTSARGSLTSSSATSSSSSTTRRPSSSSGTSRVTLTAARATRPATSTGQQTTCSATSTRSNNRPMSAPNSKPRSRSSTPTRRPSTPSGSSTVLRTKPVSKPALSQGASAIVRSRPWEPYEMPGFSLEAPSNLRTKLPDRPQTASSVRSRAFGASNSSRSASIEREVSRRQSCSPSRSRAPNSAPSGNVNGAVPLSRGRRAKTTHDDGGLTSHVAKGNQKMERVVNVRKLAPPRVTETRGRGLGGDGGSSAGKSSSGSDGFGFGRNLSKSSIDLALRHMDVRQGSMAGNFRPSVTKTPATSSYSVRSCRNRPVSSSGSSESSVNILCLDGSDDNLSDISYS